MNFRRTLTAGACLALALFALPALAAVHTIKLGPGYAGASAMTPTLAEQHLGTGSWSKLTALPKAEAYIDIASTFGTAFTIDQITSVQYHTKSDVLNPSGVDFFMVLYTQPYAGGIGGLGGWFGQRLVAEPYLTNGYVAPTPGIWNAWKTGAGANQLTFNDNIHSGNQGFYLAPTLADVQAGPLDWTTVPGNPTAGSATGGSIDYGPQGVKFLSFQSGSGWASLRSWLDDVTVTTATDTYILDFESTTDPLYVDNTWTGSGLGAEVSPGRWFGWNAFANLGDAVASAQAGGTINVAAGTYVVGATINSPLANLTIKGAGSGSTTMQVASTVGNALVITGSGSTVRDLAFQKTDLPGAPHNMVWVNTTNVTILNNLFYGPDPGTPWSANGIISRGLVVSPGSNGLMIQGNTFLHLRQPAYIDALTGGSIVNNHVSGTRGWVVDGAALTFTGNTWGPPENQGAEIALLASCTSLNYPNLLALSSANSNAYISGQFPGASSGRATGYVNAASAPGGFGSSSAPYQAVQAGVDNTLPGGVVQVAAGSYTEQVVVNGKNLTIQGAGRASTTIVSPVTLAASFTTPTNNAPVVFLENAPDIRVRDLTVDGAGRGAGNYRFMGVGFWNAGGKVLDCDVVRTRETPANGNQHGNGIYAFNNTGGPYAIEVGGCNVSDFQKNGITMNGAGLTGTIHDCVVTGQGNVAYIAQNGLQFGFGAGGSVTNTSVNGIFYTPNTDAACALLVYQGTSVTVNQFTATASQVGAYYENTNGSVNGINVSGNTSGVMSTGVLVYDSNASLAARASNKSGLAPQHPASPVTEDGLSAKASPLSAMSALMSVSVGPGCLTGDNIPGSWGVQVYGLGGPLACSISGLELTDWDYGIVAGGVNATTTAYHNSIAGNVSGGYLTDPGLSNIASNNWWGNASGPSGTGPGTGDAIVGPGVVHAPWLVTGDTNPGCGFSISADNVVAAGPAPSCLSVTNTCLTIPVTVARTTSEGVRGFSVTLQLSSNLELCLGTSSITQGTYLNSIGATNYQVLDNGGGSYTVDCAILGATSGATAVNGLLFNLAVKKVAGPDGIGTITVNSVVMRDPLNAPIVTNVGAPLSITIDTGGPAAVANLVAAQKLTGNDSDGTTKIQLTFTAPVDAALVQVYRAPYGQYPEYDDAGGAPPVAPAYPPVAPWTLSSVTASGQYDEPATRDFWYYVVFSTDACGNVSAVSNRTNGTLNYHLGDVSNGFVAGAGNNLVNTADMSLLGAHYGITLAPLSPFNYLDVGPTTDFSVNARPTTDNKVGFEDLMMFAINHSVVSAPQDRPVLASAGVNNIDVAAVSKTAAIAGETFVVPVRMSGAGNVMGASIAFEYDHSVVEFVSAEAGELLASQGRGSVVLSPSAGVVDYALLGEGAGVEGEGVLMNVTFRRITTGEPAVSVRSVTARDAGNQPVSLAGSKPVVPATTMLGAAYPNPFRGHTSMMLSLAREGHARVSVYDLVGRRIRTLIDGQMAAGEQTLVWDGSGDDGRAVAAGLYMVRFDTPGAKQSRRLVLIP